MIINVPKLRAHPSLLIGYICLVEGLACYHCMIWAAGGLGFIKYFGL